MVAENKITASCVISNNRVFKNGELIFNHPHTTVSEFLNAVYNFVQPDYPRFYKMDLISKLGWLATEILLRDGFDRTHYKNEEIGIVFSNSNASLDTDQKYFQTVATYPSPSLFVYTLPNIVMGEICIRFGFKGENAFFVFETFNPFFLQHYAGSLLDNNILECCICGWVDVYSEEYKASVFLVEKKAQGDVFTAEKLQQLFAL
ncbi:MAG: hypothetical protein EOO04_03400 [Chitinophagaceae bacterium]|nr:MAG: hypothetical protein EOO04_03400 [Chitinophagaceae bacterium]